MSRRPAIVADSRRAVFLVLVLTLGYTVYYLCRTNFSVARPSMIGEMVARGWSAGDATVALGRVVSIGALVSAVVKLFVGGVVDRASPRATFVIGLLGTASATLLFSFSSGVLGFSLAWGLSRLFQAFGWPSMVRLTALHVPESRRSLALGVLSLSYLVGDALDRTIHGAILTRVPSWRTDFQIAAGCALAFALIAWIVLPGGRSVSANASPAKRAADSGGSDSNGSVARNLLRSVAFWRVCVLCLALTLVREAFVEWMPTYFSTVLKLPTGDAARASALFPLLGGVSAIGFGALMDRFGASGRGLILAASLIVSALALAALSRSSGPGVYELCALIGFVTGGPWAYLLGSAAVELGGVRGAATASGMIDGIGYIGAVLAGECVARIAISAGWSGAFVFLATSTALAAGVALAGVVADSRSRGERRSRKRAGDEQIGE